MKRYRPAHWSRRRTRPWDSIAVLPHGRKLSRLAYLRNGMCFGMAATLPHNKRKNVK